MQLIRLALLLLTTAITMFLLPTCTTSKKANASYRQHHSATPDTFTLTDQHRERLIPVAIYRSANNTKNNNIPVIFNHGYGGNKGGDYLIYDYLTSFLANKGYFVISIQHELPTDEPVAMTGNLRETRMPNWESGVQNIHFVLQQIKTIYPHLWYDQLAIIGHSNGGDMTALFAQKYPTLVNKIITMDNRRMPLPRTLQPQVFTLRSNDYPADEGVLPSDEEARKFMMTVQFTNINHGNMDNDASTTERDYLTQKILAYLKQ